MQTDNMKTSSSLKDTQRERASALKLHKCGFLKYSHCGGSEAWVGKHSVPHTHTHTHTVAQDWMWEHCSGNSLMHTAALHAEPDMENGLSRERQTRERGERGRESRTDREQDKMSRSMRLLLLQKRSLSEHIRYSTCRALDLFNRNTRDQRLTGECVSGCGSGCGCENVKKTCFWEGLWSLYVILMLDVVYTKMIFLFCIFVLLSRINI